MAKDRLEASARLLRDAGRRWRRRPAFAILSAAVLTAGLAAPTAIFCVVDAVLLRPLPWEAPEQLVAIHAVVPSFRERPATAATWDRALLSWPAWEGLMKAEVFESVAAWLPPRSMTLGPLASELTTAMEVSAGFLPTLGVRLQHGRQFPAEADYRPTDGVIISHEAWRQRFGGEPDAIGSVAVVGWAWSLGSNGSGGITGRTIIGVLPPGFTFQGSSPEFLLPIGSRAMSERAYPHPLMRVIARLGSGTSLEMARTAADAVLRANAQEPTYARVVRLASDETAAASPSLWFLLGAAGALLAMACCSVAGLMLSDARVRRHQIAVRMALGAGPAQIRRELAAEYVLLATVAGAAALLITALLTQTLVASAPAQLPRLDEVGINGRVAAVAIGVGLMTALVLGIGPGVWMSRTLPAPLLTGGGRNDLAARHAGQRWLVGAQIAAALGLLLVATAFGQALFAVAGRPLGFDPSRVAVLATTYLGSRLGGNTSISGLTAGNVGGSLDDRMIAVNAARTSAVLERLRQLPGVVNAAGASAVPLLGSPQYVNVRLNGNLEAPAQWSVVTDEYFRTMGISIVAGRGFLSSDGPGQGVAVVSRAFERRFFESGAVGHRFERAYTFREATPYTIIGVVPDVAAARELHEGEPAVYVLDRQMYGITHFIVRTDAEAASLLPLARSAVGETDPLLAVTTTTTMEAVLELSRAEQAFRGALATVFATVAVLLASLGVYGLLLRTALERRREFALRVALGAGPATVRTMVMRELIPVVFLGTLVGAVGGIAAVELARWWIPGIPSLSLGAIGGTVLAIAVAAVAAALPGAIRAAGVDPAVAIRS